MRTLQPIELRPLHSDHSLVESLGPAAREGRLPIDLVAPTL